MIESLKELLHDFAQSADSGRRAEVEAEIWKRYGVERTVLVWDMSGFSLVTRRRGIVYYLSMVRRMQEVTLPIVQHHDGELVKFEADNGFAVFPDVDQGICSAIAMNAAFDEENARYPDAFDIEISCGLDHGNLLLLEGKDFYGESVNIASKLGEDLAGPGEILVSQQAMSRLEPNLEFTGDPVRFSISGLQLDAVSIERGV